jgi:hypothetical protein
LIFALLGLLHFERFVLNFLHGCGEALLEVGDGFALLVVRLFEDFDGVDFEAEAGFDFDFVGAEGDEFFGLGVDFLSLCTTKHFLFKDLLLCPLIPRLQISMQRVQAIQLGFELKPQLDFLLLSFLDLGDFVLQFFSETALFIELCGEIIIIAGQLVYLSLEDVFISR